MNRSERRAWLDSHASDPHYVPAGYVPEPFDVVRSDGTRVVRAVGIAAADDAALFLNRSAGVPRGVSYSVHESDDSGASS